MVSTHPKGGGSTRDTRVSLINIDMVSWLIMCCWMSQFSTICKGSLKMVTALFRGVLILHVRLKGTLVEKLT